MTPLALISSAEGDASWTIVKVVEPIVKVDPGVAPDSSVPPVGDVREEKVSPVSDIATLLAVPVVEEVIAKIAGLLEELTEIVSNTVSDTIAAVIAFHIC